MEADAEEAAGEAVCAALLPGAAEWASARVSLAPAERVRRVLRDVLRRRTEVPVSIFEMLGLRSTHDVLQCSLNV